MVFYTSGVIVEVKIFRQAHISLHNLKILGSNLLHWLVDAAVLVGTDLLGFACSSSWTAGRGKPHRTCQELIDAY